MLKIQKNDKWLATVRDDYQVGVFAYTRSGKVVLVTSRKGESWILPKGNRAKKRSDRLQAKREALLKLSFFFFLKKNVCCMDLGMVHP